MRLLRTDWEDVELGQNFILMYDYDSEEIPFGEIKTSTGLEFCRKVSKRSFEMRSCRCFYIPVHPIYIIKDKDYQLLEEIWLLMNKYSQNTTVNNLEKIRDFCNIIINNRKEH